MGDGVAARRSELCSQLSVSSQFALSSLLALSSHLAIHVVLGSQFLIRSARPRQPQTLGLIGFLKRHRHRLTQPHAEQKSRTHNRGKYDGTTGMFSARRHAIHKSRKKTFSILRSAERWLCLGVHPGRSVASLALSES